MRCIIATRKTNWPPLTLCLVAALLLCAPGCGQKASPDPAASPAATDSKTGAADATADPKAADAAVSADLPTVSAAIVQTGTAVKTLPVTGTLAAFRNEQAALSAPVGGVIDALPVRTGQTVTRGQIVLHLSTRALEGQIAQARATIRQNQIQVQQAEVNALQQQGQTQTGIAQAVTAVSGAKATLAGAQATLAGNEAALTNAQQALDRAQTLNKDGLVAQKDVEAAQLAVRSAIAQVNAQKQAVNAQRDVVRGQEQATQAARTATLQNAVKQKDIAVARQQLAIARGALQTLNSQRAQYTVRAPLGGVVTNIGASVGESIDTTVKVVTIANLSRLQLQIAVPSTSLEAVGVGQSVSFTVDAVPGRTFQATIRTVSGQVDPTNGTVSATATVDNASGLLKDGLFARVLVTTARHKNAILIPRAAVLFDAAESASSVGVGATSGDPAVGTTASVLKIGKDGTVHKTTVTTGWVSGDKIEILSGALKPGEQIATTGAFGLEDGAKVQVDSGAAKTKEP